MKQKDRSDSMGYDVERFVGYVNEGLQCCVCRDVLENPLQAPCEHAFCSTCIHAWLVNHHNCPEDRLPLSIANLRPLYRYMRNDWARLQVKCTYRSQGCEVICALESIHQHEEQCDFALFNCSNAEEEYLCYRCGYPVQVSRHSLEAHLCVCESRNSVCASGCGCTLSNAGEAQHNCISELRAELDLLRTELDCKVEEVRREMESRLNSQRRHMVQKQSLLKNEVDELKDQLSRVVSDVCALLGAERTRRKELERAELGKAELLERLKNEVLKPGTQTVMRYDEEHRKQNPHSLTLDCLKKKSRDVTVL